MSNILELKDVSAGYGGTQALFGINIDVPESGITAILGANGAGKTTTLRAISGMVKTTGQILFEGRPLDRDSTDKRARRGIAHVPDGRGTLTSLDVEENLLVGAYTRRDRANIASDMERMFTYFPKLRERRKQQAGTLSGGEQQMLAISRALLLKPRLLLMDEPSFGLAPLIIQEIFQIMKVIRDTEGVSILLVEQNVTRALDVADNVYLIETGQLVMSGTPDLFRNDQNIRKAYLGF